MLSILEVPSIPTSLLLSLHLLPFKDSVNYEISISFIRIIEH